jgi:hypothetical protein
MSTAHTHAHVDRTNAYSHSQHNLHTHIKYTKDTFFCDLWAIPHIAGLTLEERTVFLSNVNDKARNVFLGANQYQIYQLSFTPLLAIAIALHGLKAPQ